MRYDGRFISISICYPLQVIYLRFRPKQICHNSCQSNHTRTCGPQERLFPNVMDSSLLIGFVLMIGLLYIKISAVFQQMQYTLKYSFFNCLAFKEQEVNRTSNDGLGKQRRSNSKFKDKKEGLLPIGCILFNKSWLNVNSWDFN